MGSSSWHDGILQALLIGLVVQIVAYVLCVICAFLWNSWKERMARPPTGESMVEFDVELGTLDVGGSATIPGNPLHGLAANSSAGDDGNPEYTVDTRASTPEIPTVHGSSKAQCKNITENVETIASVPAVSHPYQVEVLAGKED